MAFSTDQIPDLSSKTILITGANSGLGFETARALGAHGAKLVLAVRDTEKGKQAAERIDGDTEVAELDLSRLESIRSLAAAWGERPLDILINNAGVMATPLSRTADGFELQIGTNHLGHFALTNLLLGQIRERVVTVSSNAHRSGRIELRDLNFEHRGYNAWVAYGQSKLANLLFTFELARRLDAAGSPVLATAAHPGYAATKLTTHTGSPIQGLAMAIGDRVLAQPAAVGALATLYAAVEPLDSNSYVGPSGAGEWRGGPKLVGRSRAATDPEVAAGLWELSEELTGVRWPL
ncbi:MAG: SDR family NAD(P)-dependent oxidoreductase [Solirubrobacterales bacterium]|nr:SDR family NAD(P)-dependent oxidoreductase [Solirubrobacterales bacterium]